MAWYSHGMYEWRRSTTGCVGLGADWSYWVRSSC